MIIGSNYILNESFYEKYIKGLSKGEFQKMIEDSGLGLGYTKEGYKIVAPPKDPEKRKMMEDDDFERRGGGSGGARTKHTRRDRPPTQ